MKYLMHMFTISLCGFGLLCLSACDSGKDAGDHLEDAGESISKAADEAGENIKDAAEDTKETLEENSTKPKIDSSNK